MSGYPASQLSLLFFGLLLCFTYVFANPLPEPTPEPTPNFDSNANSVPRISNKRQATAVTANIAQATVQAGSSPVHVGTLTGTPLSKAVSSAINKLCPTPKKPGVDTACSTGTVKIGKIDYVEDDFLQQDGTLEVKVEASRYNETGLRKAMIDSAALTAMQATLDSKNCYQPKYDVEDLRKARRSWMMPALPVPAVVKRLLGVRDHPHPEPVTDGETMCNTVGFAGVQYYNMFWRQQPKPGSTAWIDASWTFHRAPGGDFGCEFIQGLIDALAVVAPEFAVGDVELGEAIEAGCEAAMDHA